MKKLAVVMLVILVVIGSGCGQETVNSCNLPDFVKSVSNIKGKFKYDSVTQSYCIRVGYNADVVDVGVLCNIPDSLKTDSVTVLFSGRYYDYPYYKSPFRLPETNYYYLELSKVELRTANTK